MSCVFDRMNDESDNDEMCEERIRQDDTIETDEEEVTMEKMAPPEDSYVHDAGNIFINIVWMFFELVTILKDFYDLSVKPSFNIITNGYFKTVVTAMYNNVKDVREYSSLEQFSCDQYFLPPYKFMVYAHETKNDKQTITQNIIMNNGVEVTKSIKELNYKNSKGSIMVLRASLPGSNTKYDINLKHPHNYMIIGNVINHYFIAWYLKNQHNISFHDQDLLNTKLEYMNSSYQLETITAPYEIKIMDKMILVEEILEEIDESFGEEENDVEENGSKIEESNSKDDENIDICDNDSDREQEIHFPNFTLKKEGNGGSVNETTENTENTESNDTIRDLPELPVEEKDPEEVSKEGKVRRQKGTGKKKQEVHFSLPESDIICDKEKIVEKEKKQKSTARSRTSRKKKETCTCGVCGRECHISELNEYLLCDKCT